MIFRSTDPAISVPALSLSAFVLDQFDTRGDKAAIIEGPTGRTLTYAQLAAGVRCMAAGLTRRGMSKGDTFAILLPNLPEYAIVFLGGVAAGGVATPMNPQLTAEEIRHQLRDTGARWLFTFAPLALRAREASQGTAIREIFSLGEAPGTTPFAALLEEGPCPKFGIDPDEDLVVLPYSSGTSGLPKGVMLTHRNVVAQLCQAGNVLTGDREGPVAAVAPFFHILGLVLVLLLWLKHGGTIVALPRFDLEQFLDCVQKYRIKFAPLVPPIILALAKHPLVDRYDMSSLKWVSCGAAPLGSEVEQACADRLGCVVGQGWGMTEISGGGCTARLVDPQQIRRGSCGRLWPDVEARIVDLVTGADLDAHHTGELLVRGPNVMKGYLNRPDANAATLLPDGWMRTGDIAYFDADGYLYIVDRTKELIKYNANQIAPAELEAVLVSHPAVAEAAVIASPDAEHGEVPKAFVVLKAAATPEELMGFVAARVAPYKKVRKLVVVDAIPKSPAGKLLRRVLVEQDRAAAAPGTFRS
jgi:acyl-CoA synthetase (AMP-forming)/AMP-acid ligase II